MASTEDVKMEDAPQQSSAALPDLSVGALDKAVDIILQNNFDADTKACMFTLMKVLDNVIQRPLDPKVRSIRLANPTFDKKVASRKGGVEFLLACGFVKENAPPSLLSKGTEPLEEFLVLKDDDESLDEMQRELRQEAFSKHIITARRLLLTRAIQDLGLKAEELPPYKPPPPRVATEADTTFAGKRSEPSAQFNPYSSQRYDGMSAAVGAQLTPDGTYVSTTENQLKTLQSKKEKLEQKIQKDFKDRQWVALHPTKNGKPAAAMNNSAIPGYDDNNGKGNAGLIAAQFQKQQAERKQREEGGFTTKTMRELEKLKKQKVYSHSQLALQFSDGTVLQGKFLPREKISTVVTALKECFVEEPASAVELYVTPPKKTLPPTSTLQDEGLVPAAKVFVRVTLPTRRPFLKPELFATAAPESAFPASQPVVNNGAAAKNENADSKPAAKTNENSSEDKEAALLQRMMGGGRKLGGGGGAGGTKKAKPGGGKPKWFK
jgi:hypothetical protein